MYLYIIKKYKFIIKIFIFNFIFLFRNFLKFLFFISKNFRKLKFFFFFLNNFLRIINKKIL